MTDFGRRVVAAAAPVLPKTGQTTSYEDFDDGYYKKGWEDGDRFTDNGDGTVTDNATGLMWPKDLTGAAANNGEYVRWQEAIDFAEALDFAGHQDWRLPNILELQSIVDRETCGPGIYEIFDNVLNEFALSGNTSKEATELAWDVELQNGKIATILKVVPWDIVLPVRTA